jgi:hypothetical protein
MVTAIVVIKRVPGEEEAFDKRQRLFPSLRDTITDGHILGIVHVRENALNNRIGERFHPVRTSIKHVLVKQ